MSDTAHSPERSILGAPIRWLYNHNPFYLISAAMLIYGLNVMFSSQEMTTTLSWTIMMILASFILLLALSAILIIRLGRVWDDARSIIMVVILLFFALSISFDLTLIENFESGRGLMWAGLIFCIGLSELLLRGVGIKLHLLFKLPLYFCLSVLFLYPILISDMLQTPHNPVHRGWYIYLFNPIAALACFSILPAIRKGASLAKNNGSPWAWPWFPCPVYVMLLVGLVIRSASLTISFEPAHGDYDPSSPGVSSVFAPYFLFPIALAVMCVLIEAASKNRSGKLAKIMLALPALATLLCITPADPSDAFFTRFLNEFTETIMNPFRLACWAAIGLYAFAWIRKLPYANIACMLSFALLPVVESCLGTGLSRVTPWPLTFWIVTAWLIIRFRQYWTSSRFVLTATSSIVAIMASAMHMIGLDASASLNPIYLLMAIITLLAAGLLFSDKAVKHFQDGSMCLLMVLFLAAPTALESVYEGYVFLPKLFMLNITLLCGLYWLKTGCTAGLVVTIIQTFCGGVYTIAMSIRFILGLKLSTGMMNIALAIMFFLAAIFISLMKAVFRPQPNHSSDD